MKIVYCTDSICYQGGIQKITIIKANSLANINGNEVWLIVTDNNFLPIYPLNPKIHLINLNINYFSDDYKSKFNILKGIIFKRLIHKKRIKSIIDNIKPDVIISTGTSEKNFIGKLPLKSNPIRIREIHMTKNYRLIAAKTFFQKILAIGGNLIDYYYNIKFYDKIIVLTEEDKKNWKNFPNITTIPNPLTSPCQESSLCQNKKVITAGRLVPQKNFKSLINAWQTISKKHPDWQLEIWGEGELKEELQEQIIKLGLEDSILLKGYTNNIQSEMLNASLFVLTSIFEGFGLVITEAMSCGLPVVSYACPCGPKDIITEGKDGFLVEVNDEIALANRINLLIENEELRKQMSDTAKIKAEKYNIKNITSMWMNLFKELQHEQ